MFDARPRSDDFRRLGALALPVVVVQVGLMAMGVVDTMIVGRVSPVALAGVAVGNVYTFAIASFGMGVLMSLDPLVSQGHGAGDHPAIARALQRGLVLSAALGVIGLLALVPTRPVLRALGQPEALVDVAVPFAHAQIPGIAAFFLAVAFRQTLQALGRMRPIVIAVLSTNLLNGVLAWALVFGKLGLPALGPAGAGIATSVSRWVMAGGLLVLGWGALRPYLSWRRDTLRWAPFSRMLRIGLPIGLQFELEYGVFAAVALVMGHLGPVPGGAHQIAINIASLTFMVPLGVSSAASVLVGRAVGGGDEHGARRAGVAALTVGAAFMALSALVLSLAPGPLARAYTPDREVIALAVALIPIAGMFQVFDGLQVVSIGVLRGVGDTRTPLIVNLVGYWLFALPIGVGLGFRMGYGPRGLWWGLVAGLMVVAVILLARVRARLWRPLRRLVVDEPGHAEAGP
jgi:MATE family multidrug resistance protein